MVTTRNPILVPDLPALQHKIARFQGDWQHRWKSFLRLARRERRSEAWFVNGDHPMHAAFAYMVLRSAEFARIAREDLFWILKVYPQTVKHRYLHSDTWMYAAPMARRAISAEWIWDSLSESEQAEIADHFISDSLKYPNIVLHHRVPSHANNQGTAMALNLVTVGYIFGYLRGDDPRARQLFHTGVPHLLDQIALLPPGGYGGEGSTYSVFVADPLMALACAVLEEATGESFFSRPLAPHGNCPEKILQTSSRLRSPGGIYPGWDQHGLTAQDVGTTRCFVAARTRNPSLALPCTEGDTWERSKTFAWMRDDHVWTLLWMPDPAAADRRNSGEAEPRIWAEERVAGGITDRAKEKMVFQCWDISGSRPIRTHMNPNAIHFEAWGSLLTVDGNADSELSDSRFPLSSLESMHFLHLYGEKPIVRSWAAGCLGAHSCITVDGVVDLVVPGHSAEHITGSLLRKECADDRSTLAVDCSGFYSSRFDLQSVIRTTSLVHDTFFVVHDRLQANSEHDYTWQLVLRKGAALTAYGVRLVTPEAVTLDIFSLDASGFCLNDVEGYPNRLEGACHHARRTQRGSHVEFTTLLVPQLGREFVADWNCGWIYRTEPLEQNTGVESWPEAPTEGFGEPGSFRCAFHENVGDPAFSGFIWFKRRCKIPEAKMGTEWLLELPQAADLSAWIDGTPLELPTLAKEYPSSLHLQAPFVRLEAGRHTLELTLRIEMTAHAPVGNVRLHRRVECPVPTFSQIDGLLTVTVSGRSYTTPLQDLQTAASTSNVVSPTTGEDPRALAETIVRRFPLKNEQSLDWTGSAGSRGRSCINARTYDPAEVRAALFNLLHDPDWGVRILAIDTLGHFRDAEAVPLLCEIIRQEMPARTNDPDYEPAYRIKEMCIHALGRIGDSAAAPTVAACLDSAEFYGVRRLAAEVLGKLGSKSDLELLQKWTADPDPETAGAARRSIERLGGG